MKQSLKPLFNLSVKSNHGILRRSLASTTGTSKLDSQWSQLAKEDIGDASPESLVWTSPEGIPVKPIYTNEDIKNTEISQIAGVHPYTRGVRATMYTVKPWTVSFTIPVYVFYNDKSNHFFVL